MAEPEPQSDKDDDNSESSESEEDEGIPDIGMEGVGLSFHLHIRKTKQIEKHKNIYFLEK